MVNIYSALSVLFFLSVGLFSIFGGLMQLYHAILGNETQLRVGGRFKFLFCFDEPTLTGKRLFWVVGGVSLILGGLAVLALGALA